MPADNETVPKEWWDTLYTQMQTDYREGARPRHAKRVMLLMEEREKGESKVPWICPALRLESTVNCSAPNLMCSDCSVYIMGMSGGLD